MAGWIREEARVLRCTGAADGHFRLDLHAPETAGRARPGQFAMVRPCGGGHTFLSRPLSFFQIDPARGTVSFLVRVVGEGTRALAGCRPGDGLLLAGPFGNGFPPVREGVLLLLAGGVGVAPFPPVAEQAAGAGVAVRALVGARTASLLAGLGELRAAGAAVTACTEDGSRGYRGTVADVLPVLLAGEPGGTAAEGHGRAPPGGASAEGHGGMAPGRDAGGPLTVFACGPPAMLAAVARVLRDGCMPGGAGAAASAGRAGAGAAGGGRAGRGASLYVSLEARMGCGFGVCRGCAVPAGGGGYLHVCQDGPVFPADAVDLEEVARLGA